MNCNECRNKEAVNAIRMHVHRVKEDRSGAYIVRRIVMPLCGDCTEATFKKWGSNQNVQFTILPLIGKDKAEQNAIDKMMKEGSREL